MTRSTRTSTTPMLVTLAAAALALGACDKSETEDTERPTAQAPEIPTDPPPAEPAAEPEPDLTPPEGDHLTVVAGHTDPAKGPVDVVFERFAVTEASYDPTNLEGGTATLVVDLDSLGTGSAKRDKHLRSADYLEVASFPHATVTISEVEKQGDKAYTAKADVDVHGVMVSWPVTFEVVDAAGDTPVVEGELAFERTAIGVGAAPGEDDSVADEMKVKVRLTLPEPT